MKRLLPSLATENRKDSLKYKLAFETGKALIDSGYRVQSGGLGGIMEAVFQGAKSSENIKTAILLLLFRL